MTAADTNSIQAPSATSQSLAQCIGAVTNRGRLIERARVLVTLFAVLLAGLLLLVLADAVFVLPAWFRALVLLMLLAAVVTGGCYQLGLRCRDESFRRELVSGERMDRLTDAIDQPVVRGLTLMAGGVDDELAIALRERAQLQAASRAEAIPSKRVYPAGDLWRPVVAALLVAATWSIGAAVFPSQLFNMVQRVWLPWTSAPPFSLTQLDPSWTPDPPAVGDDVRVEVTPTGRRPDAITVVLLDSSDEAIDRIKMRRLEEYQYAVTLRRIDGPVRFVLEVSDRPTRVYEITPRAEKVDPERQVDPRDLQTAPQPDTAGGSTQFDEDLLATRLRDAHEDWPEIRDAVTALAQALGDAQTQAQAIAPGDLQAAQTLRDKISQLSQQASDLADQLKALQAELPPDAAATLDALIDALSQMQIASAAATPLTEAPDPASGQQPPPGAQSPTAFAQNAADAARRDLSAISQGLGESETPSASGSLGGTEPGVAAPVIDPTAVGSYDEQGRSTDTGPLPDAIMQQVPPSYRDYVRAYFEQLNQPPSD